MRPRPSRRRALSLVSGARAAARLSVRRACGAGRALTRRNAIQPRAAGRCICAPRAAARSPKGRGSFTADRTVTIEDGYRLITQIIQDAIPAGWTTGATPNSFCDGAWNLSLNGRKVVGTAQRIRPVGNGQRRILAHALILVEGDLAAGAAAVDAFHRDLSLGPIDENVHATLDGAIPSLRDPMNTLAASLNEIAQRDILRATQHLGRRAA